MENLNNVIKNQEASIDLFKKVAQGDFEYALQYHQEDAVKAKAMLEILNQVKSIYLQKDTTTKARLADFDVLVRYSTREVMTAGSCHRSSSPISNNLEMWGQEARRQICTPYKYMMGAACFDKLREELIETLGIKEA